MFPHLMEQIGSTEARADNEDIDVEIVRIRAVGMSTLGVFVQMLAPDRGRGLEGVLNEPVYGL